MATSRNAHTYSGIARRKGGKAEQERQQHGQHNRDDRDREGGKRRLEAAALQYAHGPLPQHAEVEAAVVERRRGDVTKEALHVGEAPGGQVEADVAGGPGQHQEHQ
ncbi:MAG: hypothetical protein ACYTFN_19980 [Planctomycetota bacterium]|jgi:hypothetical protein